MEIVDSLFMEEEFVMEYFCYDELKCSDIIFLEWFLGVFKVMLFVKGFFSLIDVDVVIRMMYFFLLFVKLSLIYLFYFNSFFLFKS